MHALPLMVGQAFSLPGPFAADHHSLSSSLSPASLD
jgi:hypothetical protein